MKQPLKKSKGSTSNSKRVTPNILEEIQHILKPGDIIVGTPDQLKTLGITPPSAMDHSVIESKKDGVKFRPINETLSVDCFVVLRPNISLEAITSAIHTAISHAGKRYDFLFDFTKANRLACTELIYRAYHGLDEISFSLIERSGRMCLAAEDLLDQSIGSEKFTAIAIFNTSILYDDEARVALKSSYASQW